MLKLDQMPFRRDSKANHIRRGGELFAAALVVMSAVFGSALPSVADSAAAPASFARDRAELAKLFPQAKIQAATAGCLVVAPEPFASPDSAVDPRFGWHFTRAIYVFAPQKIGVVHGWLRVVTVHHEPDLREQAIRTAALIGRLWSAYGDHFGRDVEFPLQADSADVYLAAQTPSAENGEGGETRNDQIYVFGAGVAARTPLEWVRTVAHEWGHLTLSAARGYRDPESDAAGYLGERLFLKWLREDESRRAADAADDGTTMDDLELYYHRQVAPLIAQYGSGGPGSPLLNGANTAAMDYYIGSVLATDDAFGSKATGRALYTVLADRPREFLAALRRNLSDAPSFTVNAPAWAPLAGGDYCVLTKNNLRVKTLHVKTAGWQRFAFAGTVRVQRLEGKAQ